MQRNTLFTQHNVLFTSVIFLHHEDELPKNTYNSDLTVKNERAMISYTQTQSNSHILYNIKYFKAAAAAATTTFNIAEKFTSNYGDANIRLSHAE